MAAPVSRRIWPLLVLAACGGPARPAPTTPRAAQAVAPRSSAQPPTPPPTWEERVSAVESELDEVVETRELEGAQELHLVLAADRCWRATVIAESTARAALVDEHGHEIAAGEGERFTLGPVCPRWTGSFVLSVEAPLGRLWLQASASSAGASASTVSSTD